MKFEHGAMKFDFSRISAQYAQYRDIYPLCKIFMDWLPYRSILKFKEDANVHLPIF